MKRHSVPTKQRYNRKFNLHNYINLLEFLLHYTGRRKEANFGTFSEFGICSFTFNVGCMDLL